MEMENTRILLANETATLMVVNGVISRDCENDAINSLINLPFPALIAAYELSLQEFRAKAPGHNMIVRVWPN